MRIKTRIWVKSEFYRSGSICSKSKSSPPQKPFINIQSWSTGKYLLKKVDNRKMVPL